MGKTKKSRKKRGSARLTSCRKGKKTKKVLLTTNDSHSLNVSSRTARTASEDVALAQASPESLSNNDNSCTSTPTSKPSPKDNNSITTQDTPTQNEDSAGEIERGSFEEHLVTMYHEQGLGCDQVVDIINIMRYDRHGLPRVGYTEVRNCLNRMKKKKKEQKNKKISHTNV